MKFTLATVAILASNVLAAPAADAEPWCERIGQSCWKEKRDAAPDAEPWCERIGQSCWKVKRAAEAFHEAIQSSGGLSARDAEADLSNLAGGAAFAAKRSLNELAGHVALAQHSPEEYYKALELASQFHPDSDEKEKRDALPNPWCERIGQSCWKRDAEADKQAVTKDKRWCERIGQSCWKAKRAAEAVLDVVGRDADNVERDAAFDPDFFSKREAQPWCERIGQSCWKEKRDAHPEPWCERIGQSCWKARRDLNNMRTVARSIVEAYE
ncbi:hypothetical protein B0T10DRAFT_229956 [Thelonectria olida]|uniref:Uncharacterized protein n=1 Tax=Thelonectria olida TaxID=1576542 RepID=A0A9P9ATK1_9HYPO|nr:hypothetical protein B0T10DRAFT_229956 [Thelonectria olida]